MKSTVILPTYNEAKTLELLIRELSMQANLRIIVVDDNSPDGTGEIADRLAKKFPVSVIHRPTKMGLSSAVAAGFSQAKTEVIGVMDADLSHPPQLIQKLIKSLQEADIAIGSRYIRGGEVETWTIYRKMVSRLATAMARPLTSVKDSMSGCFFLKKRVIKNIRFSSQGYKILLELLVKGEYKKTIEIPYTFRTREVGQSKLGPKEYWRYLKDLIKLYIHRILK